VVAASVLSANLEYGNPGHFEYVRIIPAYTLTAGSVYYVMASQQTTLDPWYGNTTSVTSTATATVNQAAYQATCGTGVPTLSGGAGNTFGPVDLQYTTQPDGSYGGYPLQIDPNNGWVHTPIGVTFGAGQATLYQQTAYANVDASGSNGSGGPRLNIGDGSAYGNSQGTVVTGAIDINRIGNRGGINTDLAGVITLTGTTGSYTFVNPASATSICAVFDPSGSAVSWNLVAGVLNITGVSGHTVGYLCVGHEF
jgi:hypothetical protein